jgi:hypothetical protein
LSGAAAGVERSSHRRGVLPRSSWRSPAIVATSWNGGH